MEEMFAVIDIGMTNKKVAIYDAALRQVDVAYRSFDPIEVGGLPTHDLAGMEAWFLARLAAAAARYSIRSIAVTTHGATFVCVDSRGDPCVPCVLYTHEPGDAFHDRFYGRFGKPEELQETTGTPAFKALINSAKGIFFASERFPEEFSRVAHVLDYPQYWGFRLTGAIAAEGTYVGCHTYLWNWKENDWSSVARGLGLEGKLPAKVSAPWDRLGTVSERVTRIAGLSPQTVVAVGIHDSNSSLLPHFAKNGERGFILDSTGTWCVIMHPVHEYGFKAEELGKVVFFNRSALGFPVKTAIFLGGQEFEAWSRLVAPRGGAIPPYDRAAIEATLANRRVFVLPELVAGSGQFPGSRPCVVEDGKRYEYADIVSGTSVPPSFRDPGTAYAAINASLVIQTLISLERAGTDPGTKVFIEGGFRRNERYTALLSQALANNPCYLTDIAEATALGAAMVARMSDTRLSLGEVAADLRVEYIEVEKKAFTGFESYKREWLSLVGSTSGDSGKQLEEDR